MISIIIPSSGNLESVVTLCRSIERQKLSEEWEVLIVANPPSAELKTVISSLGDRFCYFENSQIGVNRARNTGIINSRGDLLFFFDDDCEIAEVNHLANCIELIRSQPEVAGIGGGYHPKERLLNSVAQAYYYIQNRWLREGKRNSEAHSYLIGGNMILRKGLFDRYGFFDDKLLFGGTESEFFRRTAEEKFLFFSHLSIFHRYDISGRMLLKKAFLQGWGRAYSERIHGPASVSLVKWGREALLKELNLNSYPEHWIERYDHAFKKGEQFFVSNQGRRPSSFRIFCCLIPSMLNFSKRLFWKSHLDRMISIIENYRGQG